MGNDAGIGPARNNHGAGGRLILDRRARLACRVLAITELDTVLTIRQATSRHGHRVVNSWISQES
jgi:hypothetical protein